LITFGALGALSALRTKARSDLRRATKVCLCHVHSGQIDTRRASLPSAPVPPPVTRQVRRAKILVLPLASHLDVDGPTVPLQDVPQLSASGKFPNVRACLLQTAWTVARDRPVAVDDRAHFSRSARSRGSAGGTGVLGQAGARGFWRRRSCLVPPVNVVSYRKQRCPPTFPHVNSRIRQRAPRIRRLPRGVIQGWRISAGQRRCGSWFTGRAVAKITCSD
jgi:hypothetical protein